MRGYAAEQSSPAARTRLVGRSDGKGLVQPQD